MLSMPATSSLAYMVHYLMSQACRGGWVGTQMQKVQKLDYKFKLKVSDTCHHYLELAKLCVPFSSFMMIVPLLQTVIL